jgi:hypothetical protein
LRQDFKKSLLRQIIVLNVDRNSESGCNNTGFWARGPAESGMLKTGFFWVKDMPRLKWDWNFWNTKELFLENSGVRRILFNFSFCERRFAGATGILSSPIDHELSIGFWRPSTRLISLIQIAGRSSRAQNHGDLRLVVVWPKLVEIRLFDCKQSCILMWLMPWDNGGAIALLPKPKMIALHLATKIIK